MQLNLNQVFQVITSQFQVWKEGKNIRLKSVKPLVMTQGLSQIGLITL